MSKWITFVLALVLLSACHIQTQKSPLGKEKVNLSSASKSHSCPDSIVWAGKSKDCLNLSKSWKGEIKVDFATNQISFVGTPYVFEGIVPKEDNPCLKDPECDDLELKLGKYIYAGKNYFFAFRFFRFKTELRTSWWSQVIVSGKKQGNMANNLYSTGNVVTLPLELYSSYVKKAEAKP